MATPLPYSRDARDWNPGLLLEGDHDQLKVPHLTELVAGTSFGNTLISGAPEHATDGLVNKGQPVLLAPGPADAVIPEIVGISINSAVADDDDNVIGIVHRGIIAVRVFADNNAGTSAVAKYDKLYWDNGVVNDLGTLTKDSVSAGNVFAGYALDTITAGGTKVIAVLMEGVVS